MYLIHFSNRVTARVSILSSMILVVMRFILLTDPYLLVFLLDPQETLP